MRWVLLWAKLMQGTISSGLCGRGTRWPAAMAAMCFAVAAGTVATGCGKTMTEQDCQRVADHMREVWNAEAAGAAPEEGPVAEKASAVIKTEGERTVGEFLSECKQQLEGRRVDGGEVACILDAKTMEAIKACDR